MYRVETSSGNRDPKHECKMGSLFLSSKALQQSRSSLEENIVSDSVKILCFTVFKCFCQRTSFVLGWISVRVATVDFFYSLKFFHWIEIWPFSLFATFRHSHNTPCLPPQTFCISIVSKSTVPKSTFTHSSWRMKTIKLLIKTHGKVS